MKQLCENIGCQYLRAKNFVDFFLHFKLCLKYIPKRCPLPYFHSWFLYRRLLELQTWSRRLTKCSYKMAMSYKMYTSYIQEDNRAGNLSGNHMATYPCVISFWAYLHTCSLVLPPTTQHEIESSKRHRECLTKNHLCCTSLCVVCVAIQHLLQSVLSRALEDILPKKWPSACVCNCCFSWPYAMPDWQTYMVTCALFHIVLWLDILVTRLRLVQSTICSFLRMEFRWCSFCQKIVHTSGDPETCSCMI
jgi:hypothetical protein